MGVNPYKTPYQLYWEKVTGTKKEREETPAIHWGRMLEDKVAEEFVVNTGYKVAKMGTVKDLACPYRIANVDRVVRGRNAGLECKTTAYINAGQWAGDNIPKHYYYQCLHYMMVLYADEFGVLLSKNKNVCWYIACLIGGQKYVCKKIDYNQADALELAQKEKAFYEMIKVKTPPPITENMSDEVFLRQTEPVIEYKKVGSKTEKIALEYIELQSIIKDLQKKAQGLKNQIIDDLKDTETGIGDKYKFKYKNLMPHESVSVDRIKANPDLYNLLKEKGYINASGGSRVLRIKERFND